MLKSFSKITIIYAILLLVILGFFFVPLVNRIHNEASGPVVIAVKYDDVANFFGTDKLIDFKNNGVNAVVISDEQSKDFFAETDDKKYKKLPQDKYLGFSSTKISAVSGLDLGIIFSVQGDVSLIPKKVPNVLSVILCDDFFGEVPNNLNYIFGFVEFAKQKEVKKILRNVDVGYRVFNLKRDVNYEKNLEKVSRAVRERNVKIVILDLPQTSIDNVLWYIRKVKLELEDNGFHIGEPEPLREINPNLTKYFNLTKAFSFLIALISPIMCLTFLSFNCRFNEKLVLLKVILIFLAMAVFSILSGTAISGLLATRDFMLGIDVFTGVKIVSFVPILFLIYLLYKKDLNDFLKKPFLRWEAFFVCLLLFAVGFYIMRTGNSGITTSLEDNVRSILEKIFFVRPRFKEFLIGHPFMIFAIYLKYKLHMNLEVCHKNPRTQSRMRDKNPRTTLNLWKPFFIVGIIGQISIINTFCHIHTPFFVSLLRSFNGIFFGVILGMVLIYCIGRVK